MHWGDDPSAVAALISSGRFRTYIEAAGNEPEAAVELYEWNARLTAASFEAFQYVEIVVRNAIDRELKVYCHEHDRGIPWFFLPVTSKHQSAFQDSVEKVRSRLRVQAKHRETRDQIVAGFDFGFWTSLLHSENEELWRHALYRSFPYSSGRRKDVVATLEQLRIFRNKLAHHDSLLAVDVLFKLEQMLLVLGWVDPRAAEWLERVEQVRATYSARPVGRRDTVVVAARDAWPLYQEIGAYICQPGRAFQPVDYIAFYADKEIKPEIARIRWRLDNVDWSDSELNRLDSSAGDTNHRLAEIIRASRSHGLTSGRYQVFDLSRPGENDHTSLDGPVTHATSGKGSAFTQRQRYTVRADLRRAQSTDDIA